MKLDFARLGAVAQTRFDRLRAKNLTVGGVVGTGVIIACFFFITVWPVMQSEKLNWHSWSDGWWKALRLSWIPLLCGLYLKYSEGLKQSRVWNRNVRQRRIRRQVITGKALKDLCVNLQNGQVSASQMNGVRESILQAAALGVSELIGLGPDQSITATLLEFSDVSCLNMRVVCRSSKERPCDIEYPRDNLVAWAAIRDARIRHVDDIASDPRWDNIDGKPYRSVAAVPIGFNKKAFGALSIDCDLPYAFYGRVLDIAIQLEPYAATLALTYGKEAVYHDCHYAPTTT